jgi:hypothetical protein
MSRWSITAKPNDNIEIDANTISIAENSKSELPLKVMNNYFSIGTDAKIAHDFHCQRGKLVLEFL